MPHGGTGDVKYHHGAEGMFETRDGEQIKMRLYPNPSHLEFVDPVVTGAARAAQTEHSGPMLHHNPNVAVPVLLHGDAAFPGQGVVAETLNLQALDGLHDRRHGPHHHRTTRWASPPIPRRRARPRMPPTWRRATTCRSSTSTPTTSEACIAAIRLAMAYRERWDRDVVIDLIGYRRYGHNETDEPAYTQPKMAAAIKAHPPVTEIYAQQLIEEGVVTPEEVEPEASERREELPAS